MKIDFTNVSEPALSISDFKPPCGIKETEDQRANDVAKKTFLEANLTLAYLQAAVDYEGVSTKRLYTDLYPRARKRNEKIEDLTKLSGDLTALNADKSTKIPDDLRKKIEEIQQKYGISPLIKPTDKELSRERVSQLKSMISDYVDTEKTHLNTDMTDIQEEVQRMKTIVEQAKIALRNLSELIETISKNLSR